MERRAAVDDHLYPAALDLARQKGLINSGRMADIQQCYRTSSSFVLKDSAGELIARIPASDVRRVAEQRRQTLHKILARMKADLGSSPGIDEQRRFLRRQSKTTRALVWAMCTGRHLPEGEPFSARKLLITLLLLLLGVLPGLIYGAIQLYKDQLYAKNTAWLVARWRRAGSQIPFDDLFNLPGS